MLTLDANTLIATNSEEVTTFFLYEIYYSDEHDPLRWTNWSAEVSFEGHTFSPKAIKHSDIGQSTDGKVNDVSVTVGNANRIMQYYLENYDIFDRKVRVIQFFDGQTGYIDYSYVIKTAKAKADAVAITLSVGLDVLRVEVPGRIMRSGFCGWRFKSADCKYAGTDTECDMTFDDCLAKGNLINFGGFPGILNERFYF